MDGQVESRPITDDEPVAPCRPGDDDDRLIERFQAGDHTAFALIYTRYFDRVYAYLRLLLRNRDEAEDAAQQVFLKAFEALPTYESRRSFQAWLFTVVKNHALNLLRASNRLEPEDPNELTRRRDRTVATELTSLNWLTDADILIFVERLPVAQRQVLLLRYMLDLGNTQVATILNRTPDETKMIHHRALKFLKSRLVAIGHVSATERDPVPAARRFKQAEVLRHRRFALYK